MPRRKKKGKRKDNIDYNFFHYACGGSFTAEELMEMRITWPHIRDEVMADWCQAGSRPWAWFEFEAPEPKKVIGREEIFEPYSRKPARVKCLCGESHTGYACILETDLKYLRRLELLEPWEETQLKVWERQRQAGGNDG